jgi:hypothetical protein
MMTGVYVLLDAENKRAAAEAWGVVPGVRMELNTYYSVFVFFTSIFSTTLMAVALAGWFSVINWFDSARIVVARRMRVGKEPYLYVVVPLLVTFELVMLILSVIFGLLKSG